jgi:hypothetical protein
MRFKPTLIGFTVLIHLSCALPRASADLIFNAAADFSTASNPNGRWSYGTTGTTLTGSFALLSNATVGFDGAPGLNGWAGTVTMFGGDFPVVAKNTNNTTIAPPNLVLLPSELLLHPGPDGSYAVVRFIAPTAGAFSLIRYSKVVRPQIKDSPRAPRPTCMFCSMAFRSSTAP